MTKQTIDDRMMTAIKDAAKKGRKPGIYFDESERIVSVHDNIVTVTFRGKVVLTVYVKQNQVKLAKDWGNVPRRTMQRITSYIRLVVGDTIMETSEFTVLQYRK